MYIGPCIIVLVEINLMSQFIKFYFTSSMLNMDVLMSVSQQIVRFTETCVLHCNFSVTQQISPSYNLSNSGSVPCG